MRHSPDDSELVLLNSQDHSISPRSGAGGLNLLFLVLGIVSQAASAGRAADQLVAGATFDSNRNVVYPAKPAVVDVTQAPYGARGDGATDDTAAIQRALSDVM